MSAFNTAGGTTSASSASMPAPPATFKSALISLRFQPRPPQCHCRGIVSPPAFPTREGRPPRRPPQCQHPNQLSTTAPLREPRHFTVFQSAAGGTTSASSASVPALLSNFQVYSLLSQVSASQPQSRPPWPRSSDRGAPHFIYPAQRHRASARAKALYGISICRGRDDLRVVRKPLLRQKTWKIGLLILRPNRPIRSQFTARTPSPVSALGPASSRSPRFCVKILHNLTVLFHSNQSLRNLRLNSSALPTS